MAAPPPLAAWGLVGPAIPLANGRADVVQVADVGLKRAADGKPAEWSAGVLDRLPALGVRIARPFRTLDGRWREVLKAGRALHRALAAVPRPDFFARRQHRWATADRVAWGEEEVALAAIVADPCARLARRLTPSRAPCQVVHGDLGGNTLFAPGLTPAIIDFSPYWRPPGYAAAIVVVDAMLYHGVPPSAIDDLPSPDAAQDLARAWLFRAVTLSLYSRAFGDADVAPLAERARDVFTEVMHRL